MKKFRLEAKEAALAYGNNRRAKGKPATRYIPKICRDYVYLRSFGGYCERPGCQCYGRTLHHVRRFALDSSAEPDFLRWLCGKDDRLVHHSLFADEMDQRWRGKLVEEIRVVTNEQARRRRIDVEVNRYRQRCRKNSG